MSNTSPVGIGGSQHEMLTVPCSSKCGRLVANANATSAQSATELKLPTTISGTNFRWIKVGPSVTRVRLRLRFPVGVSAVTTSPVVRLFGAVVFDAETIPSTSTGDLSGSTVEYRRLDNTSESAAGITLTAYVPASTAGIRDATYAYSDLSSAYDVEGCQFVGVMVETASNLTGGTGTPDVLMYGYS